VDIIPDVDKFLIDLNLNGVKLDKKIDRIRFKCYPKFSGKYWYIMICVNTRDTPYTLKNNLIYKNNQIIAKIKDFERDFVELSYFRRKNTVLVLNSNQRVFCSGCKFCGVNYLKARYKKNLLNKKSLKKYFELLNKDFSNFIEISLCTGCFPNKKLLIEHLFDIYEISSEMGFSGEIKFIGNELGRDDLRKIYTKIKNFSYYYTLETFTKRYLLARYKKRPLDKILNILKFCRDVNYNTSILYIIGLEELKFYERGLKKFKPYLSRFPVINIFQTM
jgi:hypothetical protein